jgi:hypothetical protein
MSYGHMFYGVDLDRLRAVYGSQDEKLLVEVLQAQAEALENNDAFFETMGEVGESPRSRDAVRAIFAGSIPHGEAAAPIYGYVLKILCEHLGKLIGDEVAAVRDHPYRSRLLDSGPPLPIPYNGEDFPEIGYLSQADILAEIQRIDTAPRRAWRSPAWILLSWLSKGIIARRMSASELREDMAAYRETLTEALAKGVAIVSFRH